MKRFISLIITSTAFLFLMALNPVLTYAATPSPTPPATSKDSVCQGVGLVSGSTTCDSAGSDKAVSDIIKLAINVLSTVVGVAAVIMIIVGGFKYVTSSGDANNIGSAKNTILYAVVGLVVVALAQAIVKFVLSKTP